MTWNHGKPLPAITADALRRFESSFVRGEKDACWNWTKQLDPDGYGKFFMSDRSSGMLVRRYLRPHRVMFFLERGVDPLELLVMHSCDNRRCVNPKHLSLGTIQDNSDDMVRKGRSAKGDRSHMRQRPGFMAGERHGRAKLTWAQVDEIRRRASQGEMKIKLAREFHVTNTNICEIVAYKIWNPKYAPQAPLLFDKA